MITKEELIAFEKECCDRFANKEIRSPMHLSGGNEDELIEIFKNVKPEDWIFTTYRSHYHALLKGVPREWLMNEVVNNRSMHIMNNEYKIISTAIVGAQISQAIGTALAIKLKGDKEHVWCFLGDMASTLGTYKDCLQYASCQGLPITFVIEDNGLSTDTPTNEAWGTKYGDIKEYSYKYQRTYPHYGTGERIKF